MERPGLGTIRVCTVTKAAIDVLEEFHCLGGVKATPFHIQEGSIRVIILAVFVMGWGKFLVVFEKANTQLE